MTEQNKQPPAEAGEGAVGIIKEETRGEDGGVLHYAQLFKHLPVNTELYTSQTTATQAAVAVAMRGCAVIAEEYGAMRLSYLDEKYGTSFASTAITNAIPADHMQAVRELMMEALTDLASKADWFGTSAQLEAMVDRILAEKGLV